MSTPASVDRRFDRGSWETLACIAAFAAAALAYAGAILRLPGDGCVIDTATVDEALKPSEVRLWLIHEQEARR